MQCMSHTPSNSTLSSPSFHVTASNVSLKVKFAIFENKNFNATDLLAQNMTKLVASVTKQWTPILKNWVIFTHNVFLYSVSPHSAHFVNIVTSLLSPFLSWQMSMHFVISKPC